MVSEHKSENLLQSIEKYRIETTQMLPTTLLDVLESPMRKETAVLNKKLFCGWLGVSVQAGNLLTKVSIICLPL